MTYDVNPFFPKHRMTQGLRAGQICRTSGMLGERLSINEKLFLGCVCGCLSACWLWQWRCSAYDVKQQFQLAHGVFKSGIWESPAETERFCSTGISWGGSAGGRVHSRLTSSPDRQVAAGSSLGPQRQLPARDLGSPARWPLHGAAWASWQHGGWVPRVSVPRGPGGSQWAPADQDMEITWHNFHCIQLVKSLPITGSNPDSRGEKGDSSAEWYRSKEHVAIFKYPQTFSEKNYPKRL